MARSTAELRQLWSPACQAKARKNLVEAWKALDTVLQRHKYAPKAGETWGYNCRKITGGSGYSLHSYRSGAPEATFTFWSGVRVTVAIAVDINSRANPYGPRLVTDMPRQMVTDILAIRTKGGHPVFRWGGYYSGNKDAMHFEVVCSPAELATAIDWATVKGSLATPLPQEEEMYIYDYGGASFLLTGDGPRTLSAPVKSWYVSKGVKYLGEAPADVHGWNKQLRDPALNRPT